MSNSKNNRFDFNDDLKTEEAGNSVYLGINASRDTDNIPTQKNSQFVHKRSALVNILDIFAWIILIFGILTSLFLFFTTTLLLNNFGMYFNPLGIITPIITIAPSVFTFVLIKVIIKISDDLELIKLRS